MNDWQNDVAALPMCEQAAVSFLPATIKNVLVAQASDCFLRLLKKYHPQVLVHILGGEECLALAKGRLGNLPDGLDVIFLGRFIEELECPETLLRKLRHILSDDGRIISIWGNVQHWSVWRDCCQNKWRFSDNEIFLPRPRNLFTLAEITSLLQEAEFPAIEIAQVQEAMPHGLSAAMRALGMPDGHQESETKFWVTAAFAFDRTARHLRRGLGHGDRKTLAHLVRRIENDIAVAENCRELIGFCRSRRLTAAYVEKFIRSAAFEPGKVIAALLAVSKGDGDGCR